MPDTDRNHESDPEPTEAPDEPLNRAERRAQRRGKKTPPAPAGPPSKQSGHHDQVLVPRRAGRRGNR